jgi:AraC-like DNA-binding protein
VEAASDTIAIVNIAIDMPASLLITPPTAHGVATYPPGATFGPRRIRDFEFVWIIEGDASYTRDDVQFDAPEGSIILCRPGGVDAFAWDTQRKTQHGFFHFDVASIPRDWPAVKDWPIVAPRAAGDLLEPLFQHVLSWADRGDQAMIVQTMSLMLRIWTTGQRSSVAVPSEAPPDPVERAMASLYETLEADPASEIALDDLADAACVTPEHLCRLFKKSIGSSPMECVRLARLDRAAVLLARSNFSVGQIAEMCGFASQFHFARRFKQAFGKSPTAVRARVRDGAVPPLPRLLQTRGMRPKDQKQA